MHTYKVLSVRQPWAELIIDGVKDIENRTWDTRYRGLLFIHVSSFRPPADLLEQYQLDAEKLQFGAVIGCVRLVDIVREHQSPFFEGPYGWVLINPRRITPIPMRGRLGLFDARLPL